MSRGGRLLALGIALLVAGCTLAEPTPPAAFRGIGPEQSLVDPAASPSAASGAIIPAPGSSSAVYAPNPAAIVVAIDPGHGGCLDWGVPNPYDNKVAKSEKADTLGIALALRDLLTAQGITVVLTRSQDEALAGDNYRQPGLPRGALPRRNGDGPPVRPSVPEATRTRDELSARIDLANLARADLFVSLHINSMTRTGSVFKIAATQTYYTDAFAVGRCLSAPGLGGGARVVVSDAQGRRVSRQDRGIDGTAPYLYVLKPAGGDPKSPRRGLLMPAILSEVRGPSRSRRRASCRRRPPAAGQQPRGSTVESSTTCGSVLLRLGSTRSSRVGAREPPALRWRATGHHFWPALLPWGLRAAASADQHRNGHLAGRPPAQRGLGGHAQPYFAQAPSLHPLDTAIPTLGPGEAVELQVELPAASNGRQVAWVTLATAAGTPLAAGGSPPLELATAGP